MTNGYYAGNFVGLKEFWEERGKTKSFEKEYSIRLEGIKQIANEICKYLAGRLVLDVGCGPGIAASLFPANSEIIGLDFSISMLKSAKGRISNMVQGSAFNLPFLDGSFNVITCLFVASDYSDKTRIFQEAYRVLRKNGLFLFSDYSLNDEHWKLRRNIRPLIGEKCGIFISDEALLSNEMEKTGFKVRETKRVKFWAPFKLERYIRSENEMNQLEKSNSHLWKELQRCLKNGTIHREFILVSGVK